MAVEKILISEEEKNNIIPYKTYVIYAIILIRILDNYINFRQYKRLKENRPIPKELISLGLDQSEHEESQKYSSAKLGNEILKENFKELINILFIYFDINPLQYLVSKKLCIYFPLIKFNPENEYGPLFWFLAFQIVIDGILDLPFDLYKTFILDEKFGVNKTTLKIFFKDLFITFILFLFILPIIISLLVYIIIKTGKHFYIFTEIFSIIMIFIFMWVYPNFIQPLYNKFKELEDGELKTGIFNLAKRVNFPLQKIYEMDASQRNSHSNAYLFGFWKNKRIVLFDNLIKNLEPKEIEGVLGHELGHYAKWHSVILLSISLTNFFVLFYLFQFFNNNISVYISFGFEQKSIFIGLYLFFLIYSPSTFFINCLINFITRKIEYQADRYSYDLGYGDYLVKALTKLFVKNKSSLDPDPLFSMVNHSHPTLIERVRALNRYKNDKMKNN